MQHSYSTQYIAIILTQFKHSQRDLYPLTKNYPLPLFPIGNKKLIIYQLEALSKVSQLNRIIVEINESNLIIEQYITKIFLTQFPNYPIKIQFFHTSATQNNFLRLLGCISHIHSKISPQIAGLIVTMSDTLISFELPQQLIDFHERKHADLSLLTKKKKQFNENDKKIPESEIQTDIDNIFIGQNDEVLFIDMLDEYQNNGVSLPPSLYKKVKKGSFKKVVDSKIYIFGQNSIQIIKNLNSSEVDDIKPWLIQCLVQNQSNKRLLQLNKKTSTMQPLKIYGFIHDQDTFIKKISNKKVYEGVNFDSLIRGSKQKQILLPTEFSSNSDSKQYKGCLIMKSSNLGPDTKLIRSSIQNNCKIGKKVQILRSIIMSNVQIRDNCKIHDSIIGPNVTIGGDCSINSSYIASNCQIPDGSKFDNEMKIPIL